MKKIFSTLGLTTIICLSFLLSEKTSIVVKDIDEIMSTIKEYNKEYNEEPIEAIEENDKIIPGIEGKKVNIEKSYTEMKKIGYYNEKNYVYDIVKPKISIENKYDKYIIKGNPKKNAISLVFIIYENANINKIIDIINKEKVDATFFIDSKWLEKNNEQAKKIIEEGHTIGILSYNNKYTKEDLITVKNFIKRTGIQKNNYCLLLTESKENLEVCSKQKNYTILLNKIVKKNPINEIKKELKPGNIIALEVNEEINNELEIVVKYIKSKGLNLENLEKHLAEKKDN